MQELQSTSSKSKPATHLWGYYTVYIDPVTYEMKAVENRSAMFTVNCVTFLNSSKTGIGFNIYNVNDQPDYLDIDLIVSLTHPFPGLPQYNGYDVRGVFMGNGSAALNYNSDLLYPVYDTDQSFQVDLTDPDGAKGHPDGYTRWFNISEFSTGGMPLFSYTQGKMAAKGFAGSATLCPYKYYADGLGPNDSVVKWLKENPNTRGVFSAGAKNSRDYKLRFPKIMPLTYGYAVLADWKGTAPADHPANAAEAVGCAAQQAGTVYYSGPNDWGGKIELTLDIYNWDAHVNMSGVMEDYRIFIESTALSSVYAFTPEEMTPIGGGENYSTFFAEIVADNLKSASGNEYWVIVECADADYTNDFGVKNLADEDALAAFFRFPLTVSNTAPTKPPVCDLKIDPCTLHFWDITDHVEVHFDASASYDPDGDPITFHWSFDGDNIFDEPEDNYTGTPDKPKRDYSEDAVAILKVVDSFGAFSICQINVDVTKRSSKNIPLRSGWEARDLAVDPVNGNLEILYYKVSGSSHYIEVWKYSPCDCYSPPSTTFHTQPLGKMFNKIEIARNHYTLIGGPLQGASGQVRIITPEGVDISPNWTISCTDLWFFNSGPPWENDGCTIYPFPNPPWNPNGHSSFLYRTPSTSSPPYNTWEQSALIYWGSQPVGPNVLYAGYLKGVESSASGNTFWALKDPGNPAILDYYGNRWALATSPGGLSGVNYDNAYFGSGVQTSADTGWFNAKDLTRDVNNVLIVLDQMPSGNGRLKAFTGSASGGSSLGGLDIPSNIDGTPIRLDSSDYVDPLYGNLLFVLHGSSTNGYFLSVYFPSETPW